MARTSEKTSGGATPYRLLVGMNYGPTDKRGEVNDVVDDLPLESIPWLLESELITTDLAAPDDTAPPPVDQLDAPNGGNETANPVDPTGEPAPAAPTDPVVEE